MINNVCNGSSGRLQPLPPSAFNPLSNPTQWTLSNGNRTATRINSDSTWESIQGILPHAVVGQYYFEVAIDVLTQNNGGDIGVGFLIANMASYVGADINSFGVTSGGVKYHLGVGVPYMGGYGVNDVIGVLVDFGLTSLSYSINGVSQGVAFTDVLLVGSLFPMVSNYRVNDQITIRTGASQLQYLPGGAIAWG